jgi:pimeloyl-ACP methyl ester carboxylesterase
MILHAEILGSGFPVVILHGAPTAPSHMRPLAERLSCEWKTVLVHLPGYGRTPETLPYDLEAAHTALEQTLAGIGVREAMLIGLSGGSYRSFALATRGRIDVKAVVGLGAMADVLPGHAAKLIAYGEMIRRGDALEPLLEAINLTERGKTNAVWLADIRSWATATSRENLAQELEAFARAPDLKPAIARLDIPILLRVGELDPATPASASERIAGAARNATLEIVPGVSHAILSEDFDATAASIERHLSRVLR